MIQRLLSMRIRGYSVRRWSPTMLALSMILTHAIASPFWYRIVAGTRITATEIVPRSDMRRAIGRATINDYYDEGSSTVKVSRFIQRAIDAEYAGQTRAEARGAIVLPVPSIFVELPDLQTDDRDVMGHRFRCDYLREDCSVLLQSSTYFVHILQGKDFISRVIIDRPILAIRTENNGVRITGVGFPKPKFFLEQFGSPIERFPPANTRLATTGGAALDPTQFSDRLFSLSDTNNGAFLLDAPFEPIDLIYTLDFSQPATNYFVSCELFNRFEDTVPADQPTDEKTCSFEIDDIATFTLSQCGETNGPCPSRETDPVDDLKVQDFVRSDLTENIPMGFLDNGSNKIFAIANRATDNDGSAGLVDLPDRAAIVEDIIIDYLTVTGFSAQSAEFEQLLAANPDLDIGTVRAVFQQVSPHLIRQSLRSALRRQPQLWAWHSYAQYIGPELLDGLARDLVKMGLARPY